MQICASPHIFRVRGGHQWSCGAKVAPDKDAHCTITTSIATLDGIRSGSVNPMMAVMSGKVKIQGDMSLAMKLQSLFS
ncbi:MAG: SCP2 sterol-binding domain-containing protein [Bacteroidota bacterium]